MIYQYKNAKGQDRTWVRQQAVISALRRLSYKCPMRSAAMTRARIERGKYKCEQCGRIVGVKQIAIDHIDPVHSVEHGFVDWNTFIERLFVTPDKLQVLCQTPCHDAKTKAENKIRKDHRPKKPKK